MFGGSDTRLSREHPNGERGIGMSDDVANALISELRLMRIALERLEEGIDAGEAAADTRHSPNSCDKSES